MFHFSSYWCTWSRVLTDSAPKGPYVELDLTVPDDIVGKSWDTIRSIHIRRHGTQRGARDLVQPYLPPDVLVQMQKHLGEALTNRLLKEDFLAQIDWNLFEAVNNGGAAFDLIKVRALI